MVRVLLFLLVLLSISPAAADNGFIDRLRALDHSDRNVITTAIELYREQFANASDEEKAEGFRTLTDWIERGGMIERHRPDDCPFFLEIESLEERQRCDNETVHKRAFTFLPDYSWHDRDTLIRNQKSVKEKFGGLLELVYVGEGMVRYTPNHTVLAEKMGDILTDELRAYTAINNNMGIWDFFHFNPDFSEYPARLGLIQEFLEQFPNSIFATGRLHSDYRQYVTALFYGAMREGLNFCGDMVSPEILEARLRAIEQVGNQDNQFQEIAERIVTTATAAIENNEECIFCYLGEGAGTNIFESMDREPCRER